MGKSKLQELKNFLEGHEIDPPIFTKINELIDSEEREKAVKRELSKPTITIVLTKRKGKTPPSFEYRSYKFERYEALGILQMVIENIREDIRLETQDRFGKSVE